MLYIDEKLCNGCGVCENICPFGAIALANGMPQINDGCKLCNACIKGCPQSAISKPQSVRTLALEGYKGVLVFLEHEDGVLHPVSLEMAGKAKELCRTCGGPLYGFLAGAGVERLAEELLEYGFDYIELYNDEKFRRFTVGVYTDALIDCVNNTKPAVVLVGATPLGRCIAPSAATGLKTGVTADCTTLEVDAKGGLIQTRPAFGGNIMARIITPHTRPQFATVRYKVMDRAAKEAEPHGVVRKRELKSRGVAGGIAVERVFRPERSLSICDANIIVAAGRGLAAQKDLEMVKRLAELLGGTYAVSRPLVEAGWAPQDRQIGLSGRSVKPEFILTLGISGAIQFTTAIAGAGTIIAIDKDPGAAIMKNAHIGIAGDLYEIVPDLIARIEKKRGE